MNDLHLVVLRQLNDLLAASIPVGLGSPSGWTGITVAAGQQLEEAMTYLLEHGYISDAWPERTPEISGPTVVSAITYKGRVALAAPPAR